jgi:hydroxymethylbilane synthase
MSPTVRLGSRSSALALWQSEHVRQMLTQLRPDLEYELVVITTTGDRIVDTPLPLIGGKGLFTAELEQALRERSIDLAVHSLKDLPTATAPGLTIGAITERLDSTDALVSRNGYRVGSLPEHATVGTSSTRRAAQLLGARPDLHIIDLRGNADTRVRKALDPSGPYDAVVVARAALGRLGRIDVVSEILSEDIMLPAPGQGALAVQCRDEMDDLELVRALRHAPTEMETTAERSFLEGLGGGCAVPVAARARLDQDGRLSIRGRVLSPDGSMKVEVEARELVSLEAEGLERARGAGTRLAARALAQGAADLLGGSADLLGGSAVEAG